MFDQHPHEAFQGAQDHPVQHHRPVALAVRADVSQIEALRQGKITLDGGALPAAIQGILQLDVDFGPVEGPSPRRSS